ncbi:MAG: hypothetical protein LC777_02160 [Actinobacteria bacterium]|nr:hypothetical protein [Actinomycetota bacterium]
MCPRPGHAGSRVSFGGQYGPVQHRRQLYRCAPSNGDAPHRFAEQLPREESWLAACDACERPVASHEGPQAARQYHFVARGIAGALHSVGAGMSYREAALVARERARRLRIDPGTGDEVRSRHGSLVMDWVEVFAPVVFEPRRQNPLASDGFAAARRPAVSRPRPDDRTLEGCLPHLLRDGLRADAAGAVAHTGLHR